MARHWKELAQNRSDSLHTEWNYFVHVCSFTFCFLSLPHIEEYHAYFSQKTHSSSSDIYSRPKWDYMKGRQEKFGFANSHHYERQSKFDRLPLYLFEEPKRQKVVKALERAIREFSK